MAGPHLNMLLAAFVVAMWWTSQWLLDRVTARWRHVAAGLSSIILWVFVAYTSTRVEAAGGAGDTIVYGSDALAMFGVFMALVSFAGTLLGLALWVEEEAEAAGTVGAGGRARPGD